MDIKRLQELSGVSQPARNVVAPTTSADIITENTNRMRTLGGIVPRVINEGIEDEHSDVMAAYDKKKGSLSAKAKAEFKKLNAGFARAHDDNDPAGNTCKQYLSGMEEIINEGIVDGHEYNFSKAKTNSGYQLTVTNADDTEIGKIEVDDNMEQIHYERDDGEQGSLNYWEFSNKSNVEDSLAKWLAGTDG